MSYYSINEFVSTGSTAMVAVPFQYLRKSTVHVYVDGVEIAASSLTWVSSGSVALPGAAADYAGKVVRVQRFTPVLSPEVVFRTGSLDFGDLNFSALRSLYVTQETQDQATATSVTLAAQVARLDQRIDQSVIAPIEQGAAAMPTFLPPVPGKAWLNGGVLSIS